MKITTRHPCSIHGKPVILSDEGQVMSYPQGITATMEKCGITNEELAPLAGVTRHTIWHYTSGRQTPSVAFMNVLRDLLEDINDASSQSADTSNLKNNRKINNP